MYQVSLQYCCKVILVLNYGSNIFGMYFSDGMDGASQIYQQYALVPVDLVYNIV